MSRRILTVLPFLVGGLLVAAGIGLWARTTLGFGFFAYAPLSDVTYVPAVPTPWLALVLSILGAAVLAGWTGYLVGRRRRI